MAMQAWKVKCLHCDWFDRSAELAMTRTAGEVHQWLRQGHRVGVVLPDGKWVR